MLNSYVVLSDSGTINEEASIMGIKAINLRESHERPEADEEAAVPISGLNINLLLNQIKMLQKFSQSKIVKDYNVENFSEKIVKLIGNLINKINIDVWKKF
jgi:UDP-N-acetylglucosamine 2-epimerase (non-hydrolysing)